MKKFFLYAFVAVLMTTAGCNDGSIIGNDLLEGEAIELAYDDNFALSGKTVRGDSVSTYRRGSINQTYMLGQVDDPLFGKSSSDIYTAMIFGTSLPDFSESLIDSIVLELDYDTLGFYGASDIVHNIEVFRVTEDWADRDTIYSDESFMTDMMPIGSKSLIPDVEGDSVRFQVRVTDVDSFIYLTPRLNIRLDNAFGAELLADSAAAKTDSAMIANFKGLYIKSTTNGSSMIGFNFNENFTFDNATVAKVAVYYTQKDSDNMDVKRSYNYYLRSETFSHFELDVSGSPVEASIGDPIAGDEFLYVQGMSGVDSEIDLPDLSALKGNIINSAQLVLTVADDEMEFFTDLYPTNSNFILSKYNADGIKVLVDDVTKDNIDSNTGLALLDGEIKETTLDNGEIVNTVTFNITDYIKNTIDADDLTPKVIISPLGRTESPRRTVFYGTNHPTYPVKLRIAYTIL